jgi:CMP-N,N'-diacetyllegionaminic acid synthase
MKNYRILAIILARGGSKSIRKKNIADLCGKPLIAYTILEAKKSKYIDRIIVSTDDSQIKSASIKYGAEAPFDRPKLLATDIATSLDAMIHATDWCEKSENKKYDFIVELMCTNPMKTVDDIDGAIKKLIKTNADSVIGMSKLDDKHPARAKRIDNDRIVDFCVPELSSRRQDLKPAAYIRNGSIYAIKRDILMEKRIRFGSDNSRPYIMTQEKSVNIDNEIDLIVAETLMRKRLSNEK